MGGGTMRLYRVYEWQDRAPEGIFEKTILVTTAFFEATKAMGESTHELRRRYSGVRIDEWEKGRIVDFTEKQPI
jgi:hypothetical protein